VIDWARTVHGVGDLHAGAIAPDRLATVLDDVLTLPTPALHLQIGDATEHGAAAEDEIALDWLARLPGPHRTILGNHDILHNRRTHGQWARAYGRRSKNWVVDLPFARIVAVGPDRNFPGERAGLLTPATLAWLDRERHRNAKAWLTGHTHSPLSAPGFITRARLARRRTILAANLSALIGVGKTRKPGDPLRSVYLTHRPDSMEVRFRDHRSGAWVAVGGKRVVRARV
jgi:3',5'-cyclic AMP phosphodiesterase CpdA